MRRQGVDRSTPITYSNNPSVQYLLPVGERSVRSSSRTACTAWEGRRIAFRDGDLRIGHGLRYGYVPSAITTARALVTPLLSYTIIRDFREPSLLVFLFLCLTDVLDGYAARKLNASSTVGAYFDAFADFLVVAAALTAFVVSGTYPFWVVLIVTAMFVQFLVTSRFWGRVYDPVGKYYGGALFVMILLTLLFRESQAHDVLLILFLMYTAAAVLSRCWFLANDRRGTD